MSFTVNSSESLIAAHIFQKKLMRNAKVVIYIIERTVNLKSEVKRGFYREVILPILGVKAFESNKHYVLPLAAVPLFLFYRVTNNCLPSRVSCETTLYFIAKSTIIRKHFTLKCLN